MRIRLLAKRSSVGAHREAALPGLWHVSGRDSGVAFGMSLSMILFLILLRVSVAHSASVASVPLSAVRLIARRGSLVVARWRVWDCDSTRLPFCSLFPRLSGFSPRRFILFPPTCRRRTSGLRMSFMATGEEGARVVAVLLPPPSDTRIPLPVARQQCCRQARYGEADTSHACNRVACAPAYFRP